MIILDSHLAAVRSRIPDDGVDQKTAADVRINFLAETNRCVIERGQNDAVLESVFTNHRNHALFHPCIIIQAVLQLDIRRDSGRLVSHPPQKLIQRGNSLRRKLVTELCRIAVIQLRELIVRIIADKSMSVRRAVEHFIVHDDRHKVLCELDIRLDPVGTRFGRLIEGKHRIFRIFPAETAVRKNIHIQILSVSKEINKTNFQRLSLLCQFCVRTM